jgi:PAS domain S-box-containing protein
MSVAPTTKLTLDSLHLHELTPEIQSALSAAIVASSHDAIICEMLDGTIRSWNAGAVRLYGYEPQEILGRPISQLIPKDRQHEEREILERIGRGETIDRYETTRLRKDGTCVEVSLTISPIRDVKGNVIAGAKIAHDIGEQRRAERTRAQLAAIVESSDDAIVS